MLLFSLVTVDSPDDRLKLKRDQIRTNLQRELLCERRALLLLRSQHLFEFFFDGNGGGTGRRRRRGLARRRHWLLLLFVLLANLVVFIKHLLHHFLACSGFKFELRGYRAVGDLGTWSGIRRRVEVESNRLLGLDEDRWLAAVFADLCLRRH